MIKWKVSRFHTEKSVAVSIGWGDSFVHLTMHKYIWTALTALMTWASLVWLLGNEMTLMIVLAVFVHEVGHAMVAHWLGLPKVNIEFIPFLGGRTYHSGYVKEQRDFALVVLSGPLAGAVCAWASYALYELTSWQPFQVFAAWNLFLSLFNLLPYSPMDGGHIASCLMSPWRTRTIKWIQVLSTLLLVPMALLIGYPLVVLFPFVIALMFLVNYFMRETADAERVRDAVADCYGLERSDITALTSRLRDGNDEEVLTAARNARKTYRRLFFGRHRYFSEDKWFTDSRRLSNFLRSYFQPAMSFGWKLVMLISTLLVSGMCILLSWLMVGGENVFRGYLQLLVGI